MDSNTYGYYDELQFDLNGNIIAIPTRTPYTTQISLRIATQSYSNLNLGETLGVEIYTCSFYKTIICRYG